jgi:hypothetical protein
LKTRVVLAALPKEKYMSNYKFPDELDGDEDQNLEAESSKKDVEIE